MKLTRTLGVLLLGALVILYIRYTRQPEAQPTIALSGTTMGPIPFSVKYQDPLNRNFQTAVDSVLVAFNQSLSTYIPSSEISRFNSGDSLIFETPLFYPVIKRSKEIHDITLGSFDPTVGPLVNAWGFGPGKKQRLLDSTEVDSIKQIVGLHLLAFDHLGIKKLKSGVMLDFSAIAKGYGVDVVGEFLEQKGILNYMVEIGGEVRCRGTNHRGQPWIIGIEDPTVGINEQRLHSRVYLKDRSLATSGNYRNFYVVDGRKISHTIDPFTGYPVEHSLLSASVFATDCMTADALATAFMVLGLQRSKEIVESIEEIDAFFIYSDDEGNLQTYASSGIRGFIAKD